MSAGDNTRVDTLLDAVIDAEQPWPGLAAYTETAHNFFHGRTQATYKLFRMVSTSHAGVLFGQSGLGKTSLIQAGLFPKLREDDYLPVYVRLDHDVNALPQSAQILAAVVQECQRIKVECPQPQQDDTLWTYFHRRNADFWADGIRLLTPLLVLDQFEELFTQGRQSPVTQARAAAFIDDLAGLVENRTPQSIRRLIESEPAIARDYDFARANFRLLLSLREDFLPELEGLMPQLPTLRLYRMRLLPMSGNEALQVVAPAGGKLVDPQVAERIVRFVAAAEEARPFGNLVVEPALLSLVCRELNLRRKAKGMTQITADLLSGARDEILANFYQRCLEDQAPEIGHFIEDHLLSESGYRDSMVLEDALRLPSVTRAAIDILIQRRLLRLEERSGRLRVELTHDLLTKDARECRDQRREAEALAQRRNTETQLEEQAEARRQQEKNRQRMRRMGTLAVFMTLLVTIMAVLIWNIFQARQEARAQTEIASSLLLAAQVNDMLDRPSAFAWTTSTLLALETSVISPDVAVLGVLMKARRLSEYKSELLTNDSQVYSSAFSPDGKTLATSSSDFTVLLLDAVSHKTPGELRGHEKGVTSFAFSPDGKTLATGSSDSTVRLWDIASNKPLGEPLRGHEKEVESIAFSPDGKILASGGSDSAVRLWDTASNKLLGKPLHGHEGSVKSVAFSLDNKTLVTGSLDGTVRLWDIAGRKALGAPLRGHEGGVYSVAFSPDGKTLATGGDDKTVRLWDIASREPLGEPLRGHEGGVFSVSFSHEGNILRTVSDDKTVRLWDIARREPLGAPLRGHEWAINSVAFSPDGKTLATASGDMTVRLWNISSNTQLGEPLGWHEWAIYSVAFSPDGKTLATGGYDGSVRLWDVASNKQLGEPLRGHEGSVNSVAFSADGRTLATGGDDKTVRLWDVVSRKTLGEPLRGHENTVFSLSFSHDGKVLATGSADKTVRLWDTGSRKLLGGPLRGHVSVVSSVAFNPDGKTLASGSWDNTVRLWDIVSRKPVGEPLRGHEKRVNSVSFSRDGKTLASGSDDRTVRLWNIDFAAWPAYLCDRLHRNLSHAEWNEFIGDLIPYHKTCPNLPEHDESAKRKP